MACLRLFLLGKPEVRHAGQLLTFRTRKALALLIYLAVEGGMHSREKLTALFWPESNQEAGRATLRSTLLYLRKAVQHPPSSTGKTNGGEHLLIERDALGFDFNSDYELDLDLVQAAVKTTHPAWAFPQQLQQAAELYRGDFLEGFSLSDAPGFDDWASTQREHWHLRMDELFDQLVQLQTSRGETGQAIETATRWLALNPLNEAAYRQLMQAHFTTGDRARALQAYESCRRVLQEELAAKPAAETEALAERIRHLERMASESRPVSVINPNIEIQNLKSSELPLVGRQAEHAQLVAAYRLASEGNFQIVSIEGEAGIGKSRLAAEFLSWAAAQGADILRGRAFETGSGLPYQPVVDALRDRLEQENAPEDLLSDIWLAELSRLLPELRDRYPDLPAPAAEERLGRTRMFEAVARLAEAMAERRPLLIFIDDLQWADAASLDLLHYAARRWTEHNVPLLLLFSLRSEALIRAGGSPAGSMLLDWLANLNRELTTMRITLASLTVEETRQLVQTLGVREPQHSQSGSPTRFSTFSEWLFAETQGQPFYLSETLRALLEQDLLVVQQDENNGWEIKISTALDKADRQSPLNGFIAPGVRDVVRSRLSRLSRTAFDLLTAGAVLGHDFHFRQMCYVAGLSEADGLSALDELLASRLLIETDKESHGGGQPYLFAHDKIRDVVYTEAGDARRRLFHERAFDYLQETSVPAADLSGHALAANLVDQAFQFSLTAGDEAMQLFAVHDALGFYEQARQILTEEARLATRLEARQRRHLYERLGRVYELTSALDRARVTYQEMLTFARQADEPELEGSALTRLATIALHQNLDVEKATELLQEARQVAERSGDRLGLGEAEWNLSQTSFYALDHEAGLAHAERALSLGRELDNKNLIARSLNALGYAKAGVAQHMEEVTADIEEARALYAALGNRAMEADCVAMLGTYQIHTGQPRAGVATLREARAIALEIENPWGLANTAFHLAQGLAECGAYEEALKIVQAEAETTRRQDMTNLLANILITRGNINRTLLRFEEAVADHSEALKLIEGLSAPQLVPFVAVQLCADYVRSETWSEAHKYAVRTLELENMTRLFTWFYTGFDYWHVIEALLQGGEEQVARERAQRFGHVAGDNPRYQIPHRRALAALARGKGDIKRAVAHLQQAEALAADIGLPGERWPILAELGELYQFTGDEGSAGKAAAQAAEIVQFLADKIGDETLRADFLAEAMASVKSAG